MLCTPKLLLFLVQVYFSSLLVLVSIYKLTLTTDKPPDALWVSVLTSTATLWLPSPHPPVTIPSTSTTAVAPPHD